MIATRFMTPRNCFALYARSAGRLWFVVCIVGCSPTLTQKVSGTVTLDGQPLATGQIEFAPTAGTTGPTAGAEIVDGHYEVPAVSQGLRIGGTYRVAIISFVGSGEWIMHPDEPSGKREALKNIISERYNVKSELQVTISKNARDNVFDFALSSSPP